jgi:hypothetical protein
MIVLKSIIKENFTFNEKELSDNFLHFGKKDSILSPIDSIMTI